METSNDFRVDHHQRLLQERPIKENNFWLKKDLWFLDEAILIYYGIEPFHFTQKFKNENVIRIIDFEHILEVFLDSDFNNNVPQVKPQYFVRFLKEKQFNTPTHLKQFEEQSNELSEEKIDINIDKLVEQDLTQLTDPKLKLLIIRAYAALKFKEAKKNNTSISASKLADTADFKDAISYLDIEISDPEKFSEKFSDMSPRSHKKKKK
ncbi:MAG: hypothetical protein PVI40_06805 [Chlamydiota bacterium]|jgi:hypothetical protein